MGEERNLVKEAEAIRGGTSREYIESRGGINAQGYYNDVAESAQLTAEERKLVTNPDGSTNQALWLQILDSKSPKKDNDFNRMSSQGGILTQAQADRKSAYDILMEEFNRYGLGSLVEPLRGLVMENVSPSNFRKT
jgi:hypothetical protein